MCACPIASEVSSFSPSPAPVNICRRHVLHCELIFSSLHSLKQNHVCDIIMLQPFRPLFSFAFFLLYLFTSLVSFMEVPSCASWMHGLILNLKVITLQTSAWFTQLQRLCSSRLTQALLLGQTKLIRVAARWGESSEDGHYFKSQRLVSKSTSCSTLP